MGAFEDFINVELPMRISTLEDGSGTGNLPPNMFLKTTGVGRSVETVPSTTTSDIAENTTLLTVTKVVPAGSEFFVNSNGTYYVKEKDDGDLSTTSEEFLDNEKIQVFLNGSNMVKGDHIQWASQVSFIFGFPVDPGDFIKIIS